MMTSDTVRHTPIALAALLSIGVLAPSPATAQEYGPEGTSSVPLPGDEEKRPETDEKKFDVGVRLSSEVHSMNNLDLRRLDETSDQDIIETDDRETFAMSSLSTEIDYYPLENTEFEFGGAHSALWGSDQFGKANQFRNFIWIYELKFEWAPIKNDTTAIELAVGRQSFEIGGVEKDYFLSDTIDGVTLELAYEPIGTFKLVPFDFYADNSRPGDINFARYAGGDDATVQQFRGDTNTFRFGGVYILPEIVEGFDARAFGFYADIGASTSPKGTGADRSYHGSLGNVSDRDYSWMAGARVGLGDSIETGGAIDKLKGRVFGEYARSGGVDRKDREIGLFDVKNAGNAYGGGAKGSIRFDGFALKSRFRYFHADGGRYHPDSGIQYGHGFVGFKGAQIGGMTLGRYAGFHPSAYLGTQGIHDSPQQTERISGTEFFQAGLGFELAHKLNLDLNGWYLLDTSQSDVTDEEIDEASGDLPFGYTRADLEAQKRFGKPIGIAADASLRYQINDVITAYARGGAFIPSDYYEIEISRTAGTALGSENPPTFWAATTGAALNF
ncbi:MAG: hypothetical protein ABEL76_16765 [Bradymonadaceae bacterium]